MQFELDPQTIKDLEIFSDGRSTKSIFSFYNNTKTIGGRDYLMRIMSNPSTNFQELCTRKRTIEYFSTNNIEFVFSESQFDFIERYCKLNIPSLKDNIINAFFQDLSYKLKPNNDYYIIQTGILHLKHLFVYLKGFISEIEHNNAPAKLKEDIAFILEFISKREFDVFTGNDDGIKKRQLNRLDYLFRNRYINELLNLVRILYKFDALSSVGRIANKKNLSFPEFVETSAPTLTIQNLYHPLLDNAVPYDFDFTKSKNLCFLTGPNMAGKSTFLKSIGLSIYISHLGFPVTASGMTTSVFNGIITTINLSDNMHKGYSHFYSEVTRVKHTALKIKDKKRLFVIFDELFRGTNVKDAFDASSIIIKAFAEIKSCKFCISTHITEVAKEIGESDSVAYNYFDSTLVNNVPVYDYLLKKGVSHERLGMHIVRNEKIVEILDSINED
ncbi:MutS-related protein [Carboxylicivirga taeanensis]|uniref:MutS-related protein n=1 Tax=Carboxylicivirga taeanensis TaxID=1416875 RepID=UPI003F6E2578